MGFVLSLERGFFCCEKIGSLCGFALSALCGTWAFVRRKASRFFFLFLKSFSPSISVMYSNPFSISCVASFIVLVWRA